ncbi:MAG: type I restriction enzyme HsdR N-terminal domain-containing protein [Niabella sp.]
MIDIHYPQPEFKIEQRNGVPYIFDSIRKKWLVLQDEEWVRQNFVHFLIGVKKYPQSLIALEKEIKLGTLKKRFDILVYNQQHTPWMLIECKAPDINLTDEVLQQALRYNIVMPSQYLIITNGNYTFGWEKKNQQLVSIEALPEF